MVIDAEILAAGTATSRGRLRRASAAGSSCSVILAASASHCVTDFYVQIRGPRHLPLSPDPSLNLDIENDHRPALQTPNRGS
ncbi:MAG: hypothetical protein QM708_06655 [Propioniciclava sp.]|uniref:hypothetical protein n=1 Tax=Propioniciclava sp. TaxID=2038686 RepID=UPI0039E528C9